MASCNPKSLSGFSLVELMVGLLLGVILMAGAATIYLNSKQSYTEVEQVAALSENARFAELLLADSLRHVGHFGEVTAARIDLDPNLGGVLNNCAGPAAAYDTDNFLYAATVNSSGYAIGSAGDINCIDDAREDTDVLVIKRVVPQPYSDGPREGGDPNDPTNSNGVIDYPETLDAEKSYVMTNNVRGVLFDGADTAPTITTGGDVPDGSAWEYKYEVFYIQQPSPDDTPWLSRKVLRWDTGASAMSVETERVVEGVENLRLQFGYDTTGDGEADTYSDVAGVGTNWDRVVSVEMFLMVRSPERDVQYTDIKTYNMGIGDPVDPNELDPNYRRLVTHSSVSLRNLKLVIRGGA